MNVYPPQYVFPSLEVLHKRLDLHRPGLLGSQAIEHAWCVVVVTVKRRELHSLMKV